MPELRAPASAFAGAGGRGWVAAAEGRVVGCIGIAPAGFPGFWELQKLYVQSDLRRQELARRLLSVAEDWVRGRGAAVIELWSDTRFTHSHAFYRANSHAQDGPRHLRDLSRTTEFRFHKPL